VTAKSVAIIKTATACPRCSSGRMRLQPRRGLRLRSVDARRGHARDPHVFILPISPAARQRMAPPGRWSSVACRERDGSMALGALRPAPTDPERASQNVRRAAPRRVADVPHRATGGIRACSPSSNTGSAPQSPITADENRRPPLKGLPTVARQRERSGTTSTELGARRPGLRRTSRGRLAPLRR
jgi:hypothetical protein